MQKVKGVLMANKVIIFGLLSAVAMTVQELSSEYATDYKVLALAAFVAAVSFLAKNLRGQWATIIGSVLPSLVVILDKVETHTPITWGAMGSAMVLAFLGVVAPPAKSLSYETSPVVAEAKKEAAEIDASSEPPKTPPVAK